LGGWLAIRDRTYALDARGRWDTEFYRDRNSSGALVPFSKTTVEYNGSGLVAGAKRYRYDASKETYGTAPYEEDRCYYEMDQAAGIRPGTRTPVAQAYPNPATSALRLSSSTATIQSIV